MKTSSQPVHPGQIFFDQAMEPLGVSRNKLARDIDVPVGRISDIVSGKRGITPDTALRLAKYFGTAAELWMRLQAEYDLHVARNSVWKDIEPRVRNYVPANDAAPTTAPVVEMDAVIDEPIAAIEPPAAPIVDEPVEAMVEAVAEAPIEEPAEEIFDAPVEAPIETVIEEPAEEIFEAPIEEIVELPVQIETPAVEHVAIYTEPKQPVFSGPDAEMTPSFEPEVISPTTHSVFPGGVAEDAETMVADPPPAAELESPPVEVQPLAATAIDIPLPSRDELLNAEPALSWDDPEDDDLDIPDPEAFRLPFDPG